MLNIQPPLSLMAREVAVADPRIAALLHREQLESAGGFRPREPIGAWRIYLALGSLALLVYYFLPDVLIQRVYFCLFATSAVVAIGLAVWMHRPARARSWLLLAAGLGTINLGNILWAWDMIATGTIPYPSIADGLFLGGYVTVMVSLLTLFRGRVPGGDSNGLIDATIVTVGLGMLSWVFFIAPALGEVELHPVDAFVAVAYPLVDVLLFGVAARIFLTAGPKPTAFRFLALALGANILADVVNTVVSLTGTYQASLVVDSGWALGFLAFGAFALHPTMREVDRPAPADGPLRISRVVLLAAATLMAPLVMVIEAVEGEPIDVAVVAPASVILFVLVITRLVTVLRDLRATLGQREALQLQLTFQALHDPLTGLANRRLFTERLTEAIAARRNPAVMFADVDDFKTINDTLGHEGGDEVLLAIADRMRDSIRPTDTAARLGGDEFAVLLLDCPSPEGITRVADRVVRAMETPVLVQGRTAHVTISIGMALAQGGRLDVTEILRNADIAMYLAKEQGKGRHQLYQSAMGTKVPDRGRAREDLQAGIARGEIEPHYQPIVDLRTGDIRGVEALARWRHRERGILLPVDFIALAEATGLILPLGVAMLNRVAADVVRLPDGPAGPLSVHVNLSVYQLRASGLVDVVLRALTSSGLDPARLVLEITESGLLGDSETSVLTDLKALGVRLAIDDFGTGYSALGYLRRLPVDMIKIDTAFVAPLERDRRDAEIVRFVIQLAKSLALDVVAEGVETDGQRVRLAALGCESGQGFLFSQAVPLAGIRRLMDQAAAAKGTSVLGRRVALAPLAAA